MNNWTPSAQPLWAPLGPRGPHGPLMASLGPCGPPWVLVGQALVGRALAGLPGRLWAPLASFGPLWAGPFWAPWAVWAPLDLAGWALVGPDAPVGPPGLLWAGPLWAGPLWDRLSPCGPGPCGPALAGPLGPHGLSPNRSSRAPPGEAPSHVRREVCP